MPPVTKSYINALNAASIPVYNAQVPAEGPKVLPIRLDFSVAVEWDLDGKTLGDSGRLLLVQTLYIDTTQANAPLVVTVAGSGQSITALPNTQGFYPVFAPNPFYFQFTCNDATAVVSVFLCNVPIAPSQWKCI